MERDYCIHDKLDGKNHIHCTFAFALAARLFLRTYRLTLGIPNCANPISTRSATSATRGETHLHNRIQHQQRPADCPCALDPARHRRGELAAAPLEDDEQLGDDRREEEPGVLAHAHSAARVAGRVSLRFVFVRTKEGAYRGSLTYWYSSRTAGRPHMNIALSYPSQRQH